MAIVYILYSPSFKKYYTGSCRNLTERMNEHLSKYFPDAYTSITIDWVVYLIFENLSYLQARKIGSHIKRMKSKKYIENLKKYSELREKLINLCKL